MNSDLLLNELMTEMERDTKEMERKNNLLKGLHVVMEMINTMPFSKDRNELFDEILKYIKRNQL